MSSRCKACDAQLNETEIVWRSHLQIWEDLCRKCLASVYDNDDLVAPDYLFIEDVGEVESTTEDYADETQ